MPFLGQIIVNVLTVYLAYAAVNIGSRKNRNFATYKIIYKRCLLKKNNNKKKQAIYYFEKKPEKKNKNKEANL